MPHYFFHVIDETGRSDDDLGVEYKDFEAAYLGAWSAALDMSFEMLRRHCSPRRHRFEIVDDKGRVLADLDFAETLRPSGVSLPPPELSATGNARRQCDKGRRLAAELSVEVATTRETLQRTREVLARSRLQSAAIDAAG